MKSLLDLGLPAAPVLHADEALDDWLEVTASLYSSTKENLLDEIARLLNWPRMSSRDVTNDDALKMRLAAELGQQLTRGNPVRVSDARSYCPLCVLDDLRAGRLPYFRRIWAHSLCTICSVHSAPLFLWQFSNEQGEKTLPPWMIDNYLKCRRLTPRRQKSKAPDKFGLQLNRCREVRRWAVECAGEFIVIRQQLSFEQGMIRPGHHGSIAVVIGDNLSMARNAFDDLCAIYIAQFSADWRESHPVSNFNYLGPPWLFKQPPRCKIEAVSLRNPIGFIADPAARRSVIALVMRTLMGFSADIVCDTRGTITDAGTTALTCDLHKLSTAAKDLLLSRSDRWPSFVKVGVRRAVNGS